MLHVVRIDPAKATLRVGLASQEKVSNRTAGAWADGLGLIVAINAGMFDLEDTGWPPSTPASRTFASFAASA